MNRSTNSGNYEAADDAFERLAAALREARCSSSRRREAVTEPLRGARAPRDRSRDRSQYAPPHRPGARYALPRNDDDPTVRIAPKGRAHAGRRRVRRASLVLVGLLCLLLVLVGGLVLVGLPAGTEEFLASLGASNVVPILPR